MSDTNSSPFYCPGCGREHTELGRFCPLCGRDLKAFLDARRRDPLIGKVIDQRYRIIKPVGRGGMGVVYHVEHIAMEKVMAMKLLNAQVRSRPHALRRFRQEIKVVSRLSHVHTVSVFDCGDAEDGIYIVMEYLRGLDLEKLLKHEKILPCERAARIARQVCASLSEAHSRGIVHRDIKPANIFLLREGGEYDFVKVLDFGIAKLMDNEPGQEKVTEMGLIVGTPFYMAPEQAKGSQDLSPSTDIYSLGVVMYEMVTGRLPFRGKTIADFIEAHLRHQPPPPSTATTTQTIEPEFEDIILKAMDKTPEHRFASIESMQMALDNYLERQAQLKARAISLSLGEGEYTPKSKAARPTTDHFDRESLGELSAEPEPEAPEGSLKEVDAPRDESIPFDAEDIPSEILANRADWDRLERKWRWKRRMRLVFPLLLLFGALGGAGYMAWLHKDKLLPPKRTLPQATSEREQEPNNNPLQATHIPLGKAISGRLGEPAKGHPSDIDWYRITLPANAVISVSLEPPPYADVELGLYRLDKHTSGNQIIHRPKELVSSNNAMRGGTEMIPSFRWRGGALYILVRELVVPGEKHQKGPYRLLVKQLTPQEVFEVEPNDQFQAATPLASGQERRGLHDRKGDIDYFKLLVPTKRKARCKVTFLQATKELEPELILLDSRGQSIRFRRRRYSIRIRQKAQKARKRRRRAPRKRRRAIDLRFRAQGPHFLRVRSKKHHYTKPYAVRLKCR